MFYSMWLGMAAGCLLTFLFTNKNKLLRTTVAPLAVIALFVSPALPLTQNWGPRDRHMNWIPYDAAYNFLMSCDKDAILVTNGDNDTFPLWAVQEAYGIRKDVRIVNLSLLNTDWYIKQLKDVEPRVPVSFSYSQIDALNAELNPFTEPTPYTLSHAGIQVVIPGRKQQKVMRVQDKMVLNIVDSNRWRKPLYFAVTVSEDNFMGLDPYLQMEGLVYRIIPTPVPQDKRMNIEKTAYFLDKVYRFGTGKVTDEPVDEAARGLEANYTACYVELALTLRKPLLDQKSQLDTLQTQIAAASVKKLPEAEAKKAEFVSRTEGLPEQAGPRPSNSRNALSASPGTGGRARCSRNSLSTTDGTQKRKRPRARQSPPDPQNPEYQRMLSQALEMQGKSNDAIPSLKELIRQDPNYYGGFESLAKTYISLKQFDSAIAIISSFEESHPGDKRAEQFRQQILAFAAQQQPKAALPANPGLPVPAVPQK